MLFCHIISSPDQKRPLFQEFNGQEASWIVNDLESKFWVQGFLQETEGPVINTDRVLRASELWQKLLLLRDPSWQPLSSHISEFLIEKWMGEILAKQNLKISTKDRGRAYQTIGQILPLIGHFQGEDVMEQWFSEKEEAKERWWDWYVMGSLLWQRFVDKKIIPQEWMKGVLVNEVLEALTDSPLVVDLGIQIDDVESELFLNLSRSQDVHIVVPSLEKEKEAYANLMGRAQIKDHGEEIKAKNITFKKLPSMLAEVKEAVASLRRWLDEGLQPHEVAIVSPQIENYWPTLFEHLLVEGIPCRKGKLTPLSQLPVYQNWLSQLRIASKKILKGDPEQVVFSNTDEPILDYRLFKSLFSNVYDVEDLKRNQKVEKLIPQAVDSETLYSLSDFLELTVPLAAETPLSAFDQLLSDLDPVFSVNETLRFEKWVEFFERYFSRNEKKLLDGAVEGVQVLPLMAAQNPFLKKVVMIGLSEGNLLETHDTALHWSDIESIKINFGFNLPHTDRHQLLDELNWFEQKEIQECLYTHAETDFAGQYQAPSLFWLRGALDLKQTELCSPGETRWDLLAQQAPHQDLPWDQDLVDLCEQGIRRDLGLESAAPVAYQNLRLSPSAIENYFKCPFKFFASRGLKLDEDPVLDLDIDPRSKGNLLHKVCETIVKEEMWSLTEAEIASLIEKCRKEKKVPVYTEEVWHFLRPFYIQSTASFLQYENQWRQERPSTRTLAVEQFIESHLRSTEDSVCFDAKEGIPFRGVIDRIDTDDQNHLILLDYKTSTKSYNQYPKWIEKRQIQLILYSMALIEGVLGEEKRDVVGAFYYALNQPLRNLGFLLEGTPEEFASVKKPMDRIQLDEMIQETKKLLFEMIQNLQKGEIQPKPNEMMDQNLCTKCDWNQLCRYPELNL